MADDSKQILDENISKMDQLQNRVDELNDAGLKQILLDAINLHKTTLKQVDALKQTRDLTKNLYEEQAKLKELRDKENKLSTDQTTIFNKLTTAAQNYASVIDDGFKARRKQAEELTKIVAAEEIIERLTQAQSFTQQLTIEQQQQLAKAQQDKANALAQQATFFQQEQALSALLEKDGIKNLQNLTDADKIQLKKYLNAVKENDEFKTYLKNHQIDLDVWEKALEAQEQSMTNWQKMNQYVDYQFKKWKEVKVVSDTIDWGKKQFDVIIGGGGIQGLLNMVLEYGKTLTDAAKQLGISVDGVRALADGYEDTAMRAKEINNSANAAFLTNKNQLLAQQELNAALGTSGLVTEQARVDQIVLTKQMGLQADEAAKLYQLGLLNGKSADQVAKITAQRVIDLKKETGIQLNLKTVLQDVAKVSGQLAAQYNNNPEALAKAVVQAKALGVTLEQTAGMADKLLDFPTSIQNELEAELLTGKQLNLEQARYFALMGDSAAAAKELMNNVGGIAEFQQLNVLQQRSLAQAIGMSADELSNALKQQELFKGSAFASQQAFEEAVRTAETEEEKAELLAQIKQSDNAEQLMQQYQQISAQEKFNQAIEKLKEMVASFVDGPFGSFLEGLSNAVSSAETLKGIMYAIGTIMVGNMLRGIASFGFQMAAAIIPTNAVAAASIATASAITLGIGIAAIIAGLAAGASALSSATGKSVNVNTATGGVTGGINVPNSGANNDRNINITLKNENTAYFAGQKMSHISTEQQKLINSRNA